MSTGPRNLPRFLPTLTEVVTLPAQAAQVLPLPNQHATPDSQLADRVSSLLESRLQQLREDILRENRHVIDARLQQELPKLVQYAVSQLLDAPGGQHK